MATAREAHHTSTAAAFLQGELAILEGHPLSRRSLGLFRRCFVEGFCAELAESGYLTREQADALSREATATGGARVLGGPHRFRKELYDGRDGRTKWQAGDGAGEVPPRG